MTASRQARRRSTGICTSILSCPTRNGAPPSASLLQLNLRSYSQQTRQRMLAAIQRIVSAECHAAGSPQDPDFETLDSFPLTDNDAGTTRRVPARFALGSCPVS